MAPHQVFPPHAQIKMIIGILSRFEDLKNIIYDTYIDIRGKAQQIWYIHDELLSTDSDGHLIDTWMVKSEPPYKDCNNDENDDCNDKAAPFFLRTHISPWLW